MKFTSSGVAKNRYSALCAEYFFTGKMVFQIPAFILAEFLCTFSIALYMSSISE